MSQTLDIHLTLRRESFGLNVALSLPLDGTTVLFGPSGCGKTTLLRCIAGLERARGSIRLGNTAWQDDAGHWVEPWHRAVGYVFQDAFLFPHLDIRRNLEFGLRRVRQAEGAQALEDAIGWLGIRHLLERKPDHLSGGERQRVAIARALVTRPQILLLDEPLSSLDASRRRDVMPWLETIRTNAGIPLLYVTHAVDELARLADHVVMLRDGAVETTGELQAVMTRSVFTHIAGDEAGVVIQGEVVDRDASHHLLSVAVAGGHVWIRDTGPVTGARVRLRILARDVSLSLTQTTDSTIQNRLAARIDTISDDAHPSQVLITLQCGADRLLARVTRRAVDTLHLAPGQHVWCQIKSVAMIN